MTTATVTVTLPMPKVPAGYRLVEPPRVARPKKHDWYIAEDGEAEQAPSDNWQVEMFWIIEPLPPAPQPEEPGELAEAVVLPAQTMGDGTSGGALSIFARGWNGYHHELLKMNPARAFHDSPLDTSRQYHGELNGMSECVDALRSQLSTATAAKEKAEAKHAALEAMFTDFVREWRAECEPECDSVGHAGDCQHAELTAYLRGMKAKVARLSTLEGVVREQAKEIEAEALASHDHGCPAKGGRLTVIASRLAAAVAQPAPVVIQGAWGDLPGEGASVGPEDAKANREQVFRKIGKAVTAIQEGLPDAKAVAMDAVSRVVEAGKILVELCDANKPCITGSRRGSESYWPSFAHWIGEFRAAVDALEREAEEGK